MPSNVKSEINRAYTFQKAVVKSLQLHSSFDRFLVQTKVTYDGLTKKLTDVRHYRGMYILDFSW